MLCSVWRCSPGQSQELFGCPWSWCLCRYTWKPLMLWSILSWSTSVPLNQGGVLIVNLRRQSPKLRMEIPRVFQQQINRRCTHGSVHVIGSKRAWLMFCLSAGAPALCWAPPRAVLCQPRHLHQGGPAPGGTWLPAARGVHPHAQGAAQPGPTEHQARDRASHPWGSGQRGKGCSGQRCICRALWGKTAFPWLQ